MTPFEFKDAFRTEIDVARNADNPCQIIKREGPHPRYPWRSKVVNEWCVIGPRGRNEHQFALQWSRIVAGGPRVRVACKYKTLPQAWTYIAKRSRGWERNKYQQAKCIIQLMILKAQAADLPGSAKLKFDASITKPKRRR